MLLYQEDLSDITYSVSHQHSMLIQEIRLVQTVLITSLGLRNKNFLAVLVVWTSQMIMCCPLCYPVFTFCGISLSITGGSFVFAYKYSHFYPTALMGCRGIVFTHGKKFVRAVSQKP